MTGHSEVISATHNFTYAHLAPQHQLAAVERLDAFTAASSDTTTDTGGTQQKQPEMVNAG
jgi:hypothetical protein